MPQDCNINPLLSTYLMNTTLGGMSEKERDRYRSKGIFTVNQLSYTFRPRRTPKRAKNPAKPRYLALQALAIRERTVYIHGSPTLPQPATRVYLDIEGLPDRDFHYLVGILVISDGREEFHSFWADTQTYEPRAFTQFAETVSQLENFQVFHFGDYDTVALKRIRPRLSESHQSQIVGILGKCTNVLSTIYPHVYFPTFSNSLKEIGAHLGGNSSTSRTAGLETIVWRNEWERSGNVDLKTQLVEYNKGDCFALKTLTDFITLQTKPSCGNEQSGAKVAHTDDICRSRPRWRMFAPKDYALEDLHQITKCGYFDYQREKIFVKTHRFFRKFADANRKAKHQSLRTSKFVDLICKKCPSCGAKNLQRADCQCRYSLDLKFSKSGAKRVVICSRCWKYTFLGCGAGITARPRFSTQQSYGHGLMCWCVYYNVVLGLNMLKIQKCLKDVFALPIENAQLYRFKRYIAARYTSLDEDLLRAISPNSRGVCTWQTSCNVPGQRAGNATGTISWLAAGCAGQASCNVRTACRGERFQ
jgi:hypothetical protein